MSELKTAKLMDSDDSLNDFRNLFDLPDGVIYLNGNSLGPLPKQTKQRLQEAVENEWGRGLIRSWNSANWISLPQRLGAMVAKLIGAQAEEVIVTDSTSVNLFKLVHAGLKLNPGRNKVVTELGNFPTDLYVLQGIERDSNITLCAVERDQVLEAIDSDTALLVLTQVHYKTGAMFDLAEVTAKAQAMGALVLWDLSHSTGAVPVDLNAANADLAVGCGYKYLNGGPGAPSFLYVAARHQDRFEQPLTGWFGHAKPFAMSDQFEPAPSLDSALCGTPSVLASIALEEGLKIALKADIKTVRSKSIALAELFIQRVDQHLSAWGFEVVSARDASLRGSQVSLRHVDGYAIMQALIAQGVIGDFRAPDILRFGFAPLYNSYTDIENAVLIFKRVMEESLWKSPEFQIKAKVT